MKKWMSFILVFSLTSVFAQGEIGKSRRKEKRQKELKEEKLKSEKAATGSTPSTATNSLDAPVEIETQTPQSSDGADTKGSTSP